MDALEKALDQYRLDTGKYPGSELALKAPVERPQSEPKRAGPYLKNVPLDPWGKPYVYKVPGEKGDSLRLGGGGRRVHELPLGVSGLAFELLVAHGEAA